MEKVFCGQVQVGHYVVEARLPLWELHVSQEEVPGVDHLMILMHLAGQVVQLFRVLRG